MGSGSGTPASCTKTVRTASRLAPPPDPLTPSRRLPRSTDPSPRTYRPVGHVSCTVARAGSPVAGDLKCDSSLRRRMDRSGGVHSAGQRALWNASDAGSRCLRAPRGLDPPGRPPPSPWPPTPKWRAKAKRRRSICRRVLRCDPAALAWPAHDLAPGEDLSASDQDGLHRTHDLAAAIRAPATGRDQPGFVDPPGPLGVEQHQVGVRSDGKTALARPPTDPACGIFAQHPDEKVRGQSTAANRLGEHQREEQLQAGHARLRGEDRCGVLALAAPADVVSRYEVDAAPPQQIPEPLDLSGSREARYVPTVGPAR